MIKKAPLGFIEKADAVITESKFSPRKKSDKLLIVEGKTDVTVLKKYLIEKKKSEAIRVIEAKEHEEKKDEDLDISSKVSGKRNALNLYRRLIEDGRDVRCLLDRDLDVIIGRHSLESDIFFYDFYELENYIIEDSIFEKYINLIIESKYEPDQVYSLINAGLMEFQVASEPYLTVELLKEYDSMRNVLSLDLKASLVKICSCKMHQVIHRSDIPGDNFLDKILQYTEHHLKECESNLEQLNSLTTKLLGLELPVFSSSFEIYKYFIKGKDIPNIVGIIARNLEKEHKDNLKYLKNVNDVINRFLILDWIINNSPKFDSLIERIIASYKIA